MITVKDFLYFNKHCCDTYHECSTCSLYGDDICCVFRAKKTEDIPEVVNLIRLVEKVSEESDRLPEMEMSKRDPLDKIAKSLTEIEHELHDMKRILDKRRA